MAFDTVSLSLTFLFARLPQGSDRMLRTLWVYRYRIRYIWSDTGLETQGLFPSPPHNTCILKGSISITSEWYSYIVQVDSDDTVFLCALANPSLCLPERYIVTDSDEIAYDHGNFRQGVFVLEYYALRGLCLSRTNMSTPQPCNVLDLNQRWTLGENTRLQSDDPYVCATAFAHEKRLFAMPCFP